MRRRGQIRFCVGSVSKHPLVWRNVTHLEGNERGEKVTMEAQVYVTNTKTDQTN